MFVEVIFIYSYILGRVVSLNKKSITVETGGFGYAVLVSRPNVFMVGAEVKLYLHKRIYQNNKGQMNEEFYGFPQYVEKDMFLKLNTVPGIGPKTAIAICENDVNILHNLILAKNIDGLAKLNRLNVKYARSIVEEFSEKNLIADKFYSCSTNLSELIDALKTLGYAQKEIEIAMKSIKFTDDAELSDLISEAIKIIAHQQYGSQLKA